MNDNTRSGRSSPPGWMSHARKTISILFSLIIISVIFIVIALLYLRSQALPVTTVTQTSQILDLHGDLIDSFYSGENRQIVSLKQISPYLAHATLAIEDHRFYDHYGFDLIGVARALLVDVQHMSKVQGASTITQQLARNLYLTQDRTWKRKWQEAAYSIQLEMQHSKDEILGMYLNQIYYGHAAYGAQAASQLYYGKDAADLTLAESALLAGVPKGPKYYSPYMDLESAKARQKTVLQAMVTYKYITQTEADDAYAEKLTFIPLGGSKTPSAAPYFRDYIKTAAIDKLGISEQLYNDGGLKIYTTLDLHYQKIAEDTVAKNIDKTTDLQAALIAIDPRNGYIKAMVGGTDYKTNQFNRVFANTRQPGSSFKPILYLTALQSGKFTAVSKFKSEPTSFTYDQGRETYTPNNFGNEYTNDFIDMRQAISKSDNIYAVHTILDVGADQVIEMARKLGIDSPMKPVPSLALGSFPVSPFEMASAFGIIANQGARAVSTAILRIEDSSGNVLYESTPKEEKLIDPAYTYVLTSLLESVFDDGGTGSRVANLLKRPVAGKSGTTDTDAWMVGFTPELVTAVWVGYDKGRNISPSESHKAAPIFAEFTEQSLEAVPPKMFPIPDGVVNIYIEPSSGKLATSDCPNSRLEAFVKGTEPTETCIGQAKPQKQPNSKNRSWWDDLKKWWNS